jgi:gamma-glutamylcyclotransferase (GGCT)/AIG2-like uncharacterized protein YtfP
VAGRDLLFVYGTLRRGEAHHGLLGGAAFAGAAETEPAYDLADLGGTPGLVDGGRRVVGELYEVDGDTLAVLDAFEGHPGPLYHRATVRLADGRRAWAYSARAAAARDRPRIAGAPGEGGRVRWRGQS